MVEFVDVSKHFDDKKVLEHFSYRFEKGSITAIMGSSGIGKSTILKMIMGLVIPDEGQIVKPTTLRTSVVFQEERLCEFLSPVKNVMMVLEGKNRKETARMHLQQLLSIEDLSKQVVTLSGGMKRRVSIARAFAYPSDLILLDEPFTGLDEDNKKKVIEYMIKNQAGRTIIMITHDMNDTKAMNANDVISLS